MNLLACVHRAPAGGGSENVHWIFKNKDHGKISATASLGMVTLWDVEGGLPQVGVGLGGPLGAEGG
jgi:hypothetical protein